MLVRLAPIAAQNSQYSACAAGRDSRFTPMLSTSTKASGAKIEIIASADACRARSHRGHDHGIERVDQIGIGDRVGDDAGQQQTGAHPVVDPQHVCAEPGVQDRSGRGGRCSRVGPVVGTEGHGFPLYLSGEVARGLSIWRSARAVQAKFGNESSVTQSASAGLHSFRSIGAALARSAAAVPA